jgi:hypothetical protein
MEIIQFPTELLLKILRLILVCEEPFHVNYAHCDDPFVRDACSVIRTCRHLHRLSMPILYGENTFAFLRGYYQYDIQIFFSELGDTAYNNITRVSTTVIDEQDFKHVLYLLLGCRALRTLTLECDGLIVTKSCLRILTAFRLQQLDFVGATPRQKGYLTKLSAYVCSHTKRDPSQMELASETREEKVEPIKLIASIQADRFHRETTYGSSSGLTTCDIRPLSHVNSVVVDAEKDEHRRPYISSMYD